VAYLVLTCVILLAGCGGRDSALAELKKRNIKPSIDSLSAVAAQGDLDTAKLLVAAGVSVKERDANGSWPLINACWTGKEAMVELLFKENADPNVVGGKSSITPLLAAVFQKHDAIALTLLERGANPNTTDAKGTSALMEAAWQGNEKLVQALLAKGANRDTVREADGLTALKAAQAANRANIVAILSGAAKVP
jgi:ankyrin repeat protein